MRKRFAPQDDLDPFDLGEDAESDLTRLVGQRDHQLRRWAMEGLPVLIWRLPARRLDRVSARCCAVRGADMTRCPAYGNRIQLSPSGAINLFGETRPSTRDCRRTDARRWRWRSRHRARPRWRRLPLPKAVPSPRSQRDGRSKRWAISSSRVGPDQQKPGLRVLSKLLDRVGLLEQERR